MVAASHIELVHCREEFFRSGKGGFETCSWENYAKLLTAIPASNIFSPDMACHQFTELREQEVPAFVIVSVVELLE